MIGTIAIIIAFVAIVFMLLGFVIDFSSKEPGEQIRKQAF